jgi:hypothetical protein
VGIGFVFIVWAFLGTVLAGVGLAVFSGAAAYFTRGVPNGRRRAIILAGAFPFFCLAWAALIFILQAVVNERSFTVTLG